jgi:deoxyribodipyrimidine photo-lyase
MTKNPSLIWFRRDLRVEDNPALHAAREAGRPAVALYVLEETAVRPIGAAQRWFLHYALDDLAGRLGELGVRLVLRRGEARTIVPAVARETHASTVVWNRRYAPDERAVDEAIKGDLKAAGVAAHSFNGALLREPWELKTGAGGPYRVFTPFFRALASAGPSRQALGCPQPFPKGAPAIAPAAISDLQLLPTNPDWAHEFSQSWRATAAAAHERLDAFLAANLNRYTDDRNRPDLFATSRLSPYLALGLISPLTLWNAVGASVASGRAREGEAMKFRTEIGWREFSYHLLYHFPDISRAPMRPGYAAFPWRRDDEAFRKWTKGRTGIPIIDGGMRELWRTGWMHNRVRMIVASFLAKNLQLDWRLGEAWFWDTLVDADPANNPASWQWVAGCGADAAPYFRIFNPVTQGEKFDPDGAYVRTFLPELANLPSNVIHAPWLASRDTLRRAGVELGGHYPLPMVDLAKSRAAALAAHEEMRFRAAPETGAGDAREIG